MRVWFVDAEREIEFGDLIVAPHSLVLRALPVAPKRLVQLRVARTLDGLRNRRKSRWSVSLAGRTASAARPEEVKALLEQAISGDFLGARSLLDDMFIRYGLAGSDIIRQIHRAIYSLDLSDRDKIRLIDRTGEIEFRITEGADERIQLETLLAQFQLRSE